MYAELENPIPLNLPSVAGWKEVTIKENGELLVPLGPFSENDAIFTRSIYAGEGIESPYGDRPLRGSLITMFVRETVAAQLRTAQTLLPQGMYLIAFDAYRTLDVQQSLFDQYFGGLKGKHPEWNNEQLLTETQKYVSLPSIDSTRPSPHNTGGSVDVAIVQLPIDMVEQTNAINERLIEVVDKNWEEAYLLEMRRIALMRKHAQMLDFGTPYDWGGKEAALSYLECLAEERDLTAPEKIAQENRRILYHTMMQAGFEPYPDEWWHYNSKKSQMGAKTAGLPVAEYGAIGLSDENIAHEVMRKNHWLGSIFMINRKREGTGNGSGLVPVAFGVVFQAVSETGDIRFSRFPQAARISPS